MAQLTKRYPDNVAGAWYVDRSCIMCGACEAIAPSSFRMAEDGSHDVVFQQPVTEDDHDACREARMECPVDAIGNDGATALV